jgi:CelD/BcsL family acetyltransferase involved in cellulose biosynthesis
MGYKLEDQIIDSVEKFLALAPLWEQLRADGGVPTPYQSFPWLEQWLRYRGANVNPFVIVLQGGQTIAPLCRVRRGGLSELRMLGAPDSDYVGLVTTRRLDEAWDVVGGTLAERRRDFDLVHLQSVRDREPIFRALARHLGGRGLERVYERCPWIPTDQSWERLCKSRGLGSEVRRWERRVREHGELRTEQIAAPLHTQLIDELEAVERASWKWDEGDSALRPGSQREFLRALLQDPHADVVVWVMRVAGGIVAFALVLVSHDRWYYYLPSFRRDIPNAGALLLAQIVEAACLGGCATVDLLRGDHGYKRTWSDRTDSVYEIVWPISIGGQAASLLYAARWRAARSDRVKGLWARLRGIGDRRR